MAAVDQLGALIANAKRIVALTRRQHVDRGRYSGCPINRCFGTKYRPINLSDFLASVEMRRESWWRRLARRTRGEHRTRTNVIT